MSFAEMIDSSALRPFGGGTIDGGTDTSLPLLLLNPQRADVSVAAGCNPMARLVILFTQPSQASVNIRLQEGAALSVAHIVLADALVETKVVQAARSSCRTVAAVLRKASLSFATRLEGCGAESSLDGVFIAAGTERISVGVNVEHLVPECTSRSSVHGIAAGRSTGEFRGLVYVAPDAQRTDARQQSRNIELDGGRITAMPQLEIYADDVRCSHGATVGRQDGDEIFYLRQRGLDSRQARRLLLEGFAGEAVQRWSFEDGVRLAAESAVAEKLLEL